LIYSKQRILYSSARHRYHFEFLGKLRRKVGRSAKFFFPDGPARLSTDSYGRLFASVYRADGIDAIVGAGVFEGSHGQAT
jgi:hypothetical protein